MLAKQVDIPRIKPLGFVEIRFAPLPLASSALDIGQGLGDPAAIGDEFARSLKIEDRRIVFLYARVMVITLREQAFTQVGLKSERGLGRLSRLVTQRESRLKSRGDVAAGFHK